MDGNLLIGLVIILKVHPRIGFFMSNLDGSIVQEKPSMILGYGQKIGIGRGQAI